MKTTIKQHQIYNSIEDYEEKCYLFSPSISKRRSIGDKSYYVRRYFNGKKAFMKVMEQLATKQIHKSLR